MKTRKNNYTKVILICCCIIFLATCRHKTIESIDQKYTGITDPFNETESIQFEKGKILKQTKKVNEFTYAKEQFIKKEIEEKIIDVKPNDKLHPLIKEWLNSKDPDDLVDLVLSFQDNVKIPRFPDMKEDESRSSEYNKRALEKSRKLVEIIKAKRNKNQEELISQLGKYDVKIHERRWIINGFSVSMPLGKTKGLVELDNLLYIEPVYTEDKPPQNANSNDDVQDGRARIVNDPYFNLGQTTGYIGLFDTGVEPNHDLFNSPDHIDYMYDCVNGGNNCNNTGNANYNPEDDCWNHGTSTAAILTGNDSHGNDFRGTTGIIVDNLKVYPNGCGGLNTTAVLRAFERAIEIGDRIIVAEMQGSGSHWSSISQAADNAFEGGSVVIAANGNNGDDASTVNTPANAHKVIGIGNYDVQTGNEIVSQSRGPTSDNRFKPDLRCPTNTETASNTGVSAFRNFSGTSGATPYGGGAAALVRNFLRGNSGSIDPGKVCAFMINAGQNSYPFNNDIGAGDLELPVNGQVWWGKIQISDHQTIEIPINVTQSNRNTFDAAIWWPEELIELSSSWLFPFLIDSHDDVDLVIADPNGTVKDGSYSIPSVFERVRYSGNVSTGTWKVRINGYDVKGSQTVYWVATVHDK